MAQSSVLGIITQVNQPETGVSKTGNQWVRQTIIVKKINNSQYESFVALDLNSQKSIDAVQPAVGNIGEFFFDAESRAGKTDPQTGNTRWFTSLSCYKVKPYQTANAAPEVVQQVQQQAQPQNFAQQGWSQPQTGMWTPQGGQQGGAPW